MKQYAEEMYESAARRAVPNWPSQKTIE
jgi:hypothetical protein